MKRRYLGLVLLTIGTASSWAADPRARVVEATLEDLANRNAAAVGSIETTPRPATDPLAGDRVDLVPDDGPARDTVVAAEAQSSLHRLRRETTSKRTSDERKARVDEKLDRAASEPN